MVSRSTVAAGGHLMTEHLSRKRDRGKWFECEVHNWTYEFTDDECPICRGEDDERKHLTKFIFDKILCSDISCDEGWCLAGKRIITELALRGVDE